MTPLLDYTSKAYVVIHGHFYQPPRENPWIEEIELEESAYPFPNWNARITHECYTPNACARINDDQIRIIDIVNNYSHMSYNFGPTLLRWLEVSAPRTYQRILAADRESQARLGFGNAIAQAYNHVILPLANARDRETEIIWGLKDFAHRFQRPAEAMWLPETAANYPTLAALADHGMKFVILAPGQAKRVRPLGGGPWQEVHPGTLDVTQPYRCYLKDDKGVKRPNRYIDVFFYNGAVAAEISFGEVLTESQRLVDRMAADRNLEKGRPQVLNVATDGETFGHHKKFGELALAYALTHLFPQEQMTVTNYRAFLEVYPPSWEVEISLGPLGEGTSWSCAHGVGRWQQDCGCHTGGQPGWNQAWREPLRQALDYLNERLAAIFEQEGGRYFKDPWAARNAYIDVILDRGQARQEEFFAQQGVPGLDAGGRVEACKLLEMQRHVLLMYTSCGWFFSDLSGLETLQVIKYAARALQLGQEFTAADVQNPFLERLEQARSNIPEQGTGRDIYVNRILPAVVTFPKLVNQFAICLMQHRERECPNLIYHYRPKLLDYAHQQQGSMELTLGRVQLTSGVTGEARTLGFASLFMGSYLYRTQVKADISREEFVELKDMLFQALREAPEDIVTRLAGVLGSRFYTVRDMFRQEKRDIFQGLLEKTQDEGQGFLVHLYEMVRPLLLAMAEEGLALPPLFKATSMVATRKAIIDQVTLWQDDLRGWETDQILTGVIQDCQILGLNLGTDPAGLQVEKLLLELLKALEENWTLPQVESLREFLSLGLQLPVNVDLGEAQNRFFSCMENRFPALAAASRRGQSEAQHLAEALVRVAGLLRFNTGRFMQQVS